MLSANEDAIVKAAVLKWNMGGSNEDRLARNAKLRRSQAERGDVSGQAKANQEAMMGLGPKPTPKAPVDPERQSMYDQIDQISAGQGSGKSGGMVNAAKDIAGRAAGAVGGAATGAKEALVGSGGDDYDKRLQALTQNPNTSVEHNAGKPGMAQNAFSAIGGAAGAAKDWLGQKGGQAMDAAGNVAEKVGAAGGQAMQYGKQGLGGAARMMGEAAQATPGMARNAFSSLGNVARAAGRGLAAGAGAVGQGIQAAGQGASNVAQTALYGSDRSGRDASGLIMPGMGNLAGQAAAGVKGALTGQGAWNAIEQRNQQAYGGPGAPAMDRAGQTNMKQNLANAKTQEKWANLPPQFADAAGYQTPEQRAGAAEGTLAQGTSDPNLAQATGGLNGNPEVPDKVKETTETQMNADGTPNETKTTSVQTMDAMNATGGGNQAAPGGGGGNAALPDRAKKDEAQTESGDQGATTGGQQNAGVYQSGANAAQQALVNQAQQQAQTRGGIGTGILSNVATMGLSGLARGLYNANQRNQGQNKLRQMAGGNFTASFDSPLADHWEFQKTVDIFRDRNSTEAIRYAYR